MSDAESITELQSQLTHLERHIAEQDAEFYQLAKRVDACYIVSNGTSSQSLQIT